MARELTPAALWKALMTPPERLERDHAKGYLFAPYSYKNRRRLSCFGVARYSVAVLLEAQTEVASFNEKPGKLEIPVGPGNSIVIAPLLASASKSNKLSVHLLNFENRDFDDEVSTSAARDSLNIWAKKAAVSVVDWTSKGLLEKSLTISNIEQILRYVSVPGRAFDGGVRRSIQRRLSAGPLSVAHLREAFSGTDPELVMTALADLLLGGVAEINWAKSRFTLQSTVKLSGDYGSRNQ